MKSTQITVLLAVAFVAFAYSGASSVQAQDEEPKRVVRYYDVADLTQPGWTSLAGPEQFSPQLLGWSRWYVDFEPEEPIGAETIAEAVAELAGSVVAEVDEDAGWQSLANGEFFIETTEDGHRRAAAAIELLRRAAPGEVSIEVADVTIPRESIDESAVSLLRRAATGALDDAGFAQLRGRDVGHGVGGATIAVTAGQGGQIEQVRHASCVMEMDVEIAEGAQIADPIVLRVEDGLRVRAIPYVMVDGRVLLRAFATVGAIDRPFRRVNLGRPEIGTLELPTLRAGFVSTSAVLTPGESATMVLWRPNGAARVLRFTLISAETGEHGGTLDVFPMGALTTLRGVNRVMWGENPDEDPPLGISIHPQDEWLNPVTEADLVRELLWREYPDPFENDEAYLETHEWLGGGAFIARGTSSLLENLRAQIAEIEKRGLQSVDMSVRLEERRPHGGGARTISIVSSAVPIGHTAALGAYREDAYVADLDVEVAQNAKISDPIVRRTLHGVLGNVIVRRAGSDYVAALEMRVTASAEPGEQISHGVETVGLVERTVSEVRHIHRRIELAVGKPHEITMGASPFSNDVAQLVAVIEIHR